jgi:LPS export ABC transporter protein LptC
MQRQFWQRIKYVRWLLLLTMVGGLVALVLGLKFRSAELIVPAVVETATSAGSSLSLNNFEYRDIKEGNARWTVWAATATYFEEKRETVLDQVKAVFFLENGKKVRLEGDTGTLHNDTNNMEINGNVKVRYDDAYELTTDRLLYDREQELIHTAAKVLVEGEGLILRGQGMRLEIAKRALTILSHIETVVEGTLSLGAQQRKAS